MRIGTLLAGCASALVGFVSGQCQCDCPCQPTEDPCKLPNPPDSCAEPDPCMGNDPPEWCGPSTGDPCEGPDPPWFCPGKIEDPFSIVNDTDSGFRFTQYKATYTLGDQRIIYRVARPETVPEGQGFDVAIQVIAPVDVGWAGLAWGAGMINNPLTVVWANCSNVVVSSRWATSRAIPEPYSGATYEILEAGTFVNQTHYQITAKCSGCTSWVDPDKGRVTVNPIGFNEFAWAYAIEAPPKPADNASTFSFHDAHGVFQNNLTEAGNEQFDALVARNRVPPSPGVVLPDGQCIYTKPPVDDGRITITKTEVSTATITIPGPTVTLTVAPTPTNCSPPRQ